MVLKLNNADPGFEPAFADFLARARADTDDVTGAVRQIIDAVRADGFAAVAMYTEQFDGHALPADGGPIAGPALKAAAERIPADLRAALELAATRIRAFHERQLPADERFEDPAGLVLGWRWTPVDAAGLYTPGGRAVYPSSVLMNAIPAKVAGVARLALAVPCPRGEPNDAVLASAWIAGIDEVWPVGGAQAIAALAYGAGPIRPVDVIVGPGNAYVAEAKRQVFGQVGIDSIAGPSEILVVADSANDPDWIGADLLSQAEHDPSSQSILITDDEGFADRVGRAIEAQIAQSPRREIAAAAWSNNSALIIVRQLADAPRLINAIAPEHLELAIADPDALLPAIRHAGAIFLGRHTPEALGDYLAGPNHVLPTSGAARYASGLSVLNFMKRTTLLSASEKGLNAIGPAGAVLADAEGLPAHAASIRRRLDEPKGGPRDR